MRIDGRAPLTWEKVNEQSAKVLQTKLDTSLYRGVDHALFELCLGLHLKFTHKRKIVARFGAGSHGEAIRLEMAKLGVRFKPEFGEDLKSEVKSTLVFISDSDDALTGALYPNEEHHDSLREFNIFRIFIWHHLFYYQEKMPEVGPHDMFILGLDKDLAVVVRGEKVILPQLSTSVMSWGSAELNLLSECSSRRAIEDSVKVRNFEANLPEGFRPWFSSEEKARIFDRALIWHPKIDGMALLEMLASEFDFKLQEPGDWGLVECASYSRWGNQHWLDQGVQLGYSMEQVRGLLAIGTNLLRQPDFEIKFKNLVKKYHSLYS